MIDDIKVGWEKINLEPLIVFPLAILIVGVLPVVLEWFGLQPPWSDIISAIFAALLTAIEILRTRGRMEKTAIDQGRRWA